MTSRRRFLFIVGGLVVAASGQLAAPLALRSTPRRVRRVLEDQFGRDLVAGEAADRFIADISKKLDEPDGFQTLAVHIGAIYEIPFTRRKEMQVVLTQLLRRTNIYRRYCGADDELIYVSLDLYEVGCSDSLAIQAGVSGGARLDSHPPSIRRGSARKFGNAF